MARYANNDEIRRKNGLGKGTQTVHLVILKLPKIETGKKMNGRNGKKGKATLFIHGLCLKLEARGAVYKKKYYK